MPRPEANRPLSVAHEHASLGDSPPMRALQSRLERAAAAPAAPFIVVGETGSGKELCARVVHHRSARRAGPFVTFDCRAVEERGHTAELVGEGGAWQRARGGTLFIDHIGYLCQPAQAALVDRLAPKGVTDGTAARLIAACERAPGTAGGPALHPGLGERLAAWIIDVPALRTRLDDVPSLAAHFMARVRTEHGLTAERISAEAMDRLMRHGWPGNVRELQTVLYRAMLASDGREVRPEHLPAGVGDVTLSAGGTDEEPITPLAEIERREIIRALHRTRGNVTIAATQLGIGRATLYRRVAELKLVLPDFNPDRRVRTPAEG